MAHLKDRLPLGQQVIRYCSSLNDIAAYLHLQLAHVKPSFTRFKHSTLRSVLTFPFLSDSLQIACNETVVIPIKVQDTAICFCPNL